jgi:hypothetical protein
MKIVFSMVGLSYSGVGLVEMGREFDNLVCLVYSDSPTAKEDVPIHKGDDVGKAFLAGLQEADSKKCHTTIYVNEMLVGYICGHERGEKHPPTSIKLPGATKHALVLIGKEKKQH